MRDIFIRAVFLAAAFLCEPTVAAQPPGVVIGWAMDDGGEIIGKTNISPKNYGTPATGVVMVAGLALTNAIAIAAGGAHYLALTSEGTVVAWGANLEGEAVGFDVPGSDLASGVVKIRGQPLAGATSIAAGRTTAESFSMALKGDGSVEAWGTRLQGQAAVPTGLTNVVAISAGSDQGLALKADGTVGSWGWGNPPPPGLSNVVAISAAGEYGQNLALTRDGRVTDWEVHGSRHSPRAPAGLSNVVAVSAGWHHNLALRRDGTVVGWGFNNWGEATGTTNPVPDTQTTGVVMVAGQVLSNVVAIAAGQDHSLGLRKDGTIAYWGSHFGPGVPRGLSNVVAISTSGYSCLAITTNSAAAERFGLRKRESAEKN